MDANIAILYLKSLYQRLMAPIKYGVMHMRQITKLHDFNWVFDQDYCGRILKGDFSDKLKRRVAECILLFRNFNATANPSLPYISAWHEDSDKSIWYEFAASKLLDLLKCQSCEVSEIFRDSIIKWCSYDYEANNDTVSQKMLCRTALTGMRKKLRDDGKLSGNVEAVYKIALQDNKIIWLKDMASVESFQDDRICLSLGALMDVTKEMEKEEQRQAEEEELRGKHAALEKELEKQSKKLWKTQIEMIYRLAQAAGYHDNSTGLHITKMSHYCDILSEAVGLNNEERELLFHATSMHDVGKIAIAEAILQKPGKLDEHEFELIKTHSVIGAKLLSGNDSPLLEMAQSIALNHHERWDGAGYPNGLCGDEIPLSGRIAAICDVFDALTSERPYKKAWRINDALSEVKKGRGTKFDPELVDLFLSRKSHIADIKRRFQVDHEQGCA